MTLVEAGAAGCYTSQLPPKPMVTLPRLDDHRYLAAAIRMFKHAREALVILEHVDILESNFAPGEILTGSRSIGSEILAKDKNRFAGHRFCSFQV